MTVHDFSPNYLDHAVDLSLQTMGDKVSLALCRERLSAELAKEDSQALMVLDGQTLVAFAVDSVRIDGIWNDSSWVLLGGWGVRPDRSEALGLLYQEQARRLVAKDIRYHVIQVPSDNLSLIDVWNNLGFAKQQSHGILDFQKADFQSPQASVPYIVRKFRKDDSTQLAGFSRLIAEFQATSPCFAPTPEKYKQELDKGFKELPDDSEADIYVTELDGTLIGYQVYYPEDGGFYMIPEKSVELAVSGVLEEYRGTGVGAALTSFALKQQQEKGFAYAVTDWRCANLLSSRFWQRVGFTAVAHRLVRVIDPLAKA